MQINLFSFGSYYLIKQRIPKRREISKERVTFLLCTNADGSQKLNLKVIGIARNLRPFKNVQIPVGYKATKNLGWFIETIHHTEQVTTFLRSHALEAELSSDDGNLIAMFMPPNCTAPIQPMDQKRIHLTKLFNYNRLFSSSLYVFWRRKRRKMR